MLIVINIFDATLFIYLFSIGNKSKSSATIWAVNSPTLTYNEIDISYLLLN